MHMSLRLWTMNWYSALVFLLVSINQPLAGAEKGASTTSGWRDCQCEASVVVNCGVDGKTYSNHCLRECNGVQLRHLGYCTTGVCRCPQKVELNCGVDNNTYYNHCMRECDGVQLNYEGPCASKRTEALSGNLQLHVASPRIAKSSSSPTTEDTSDIQPQQPALAQNNQDPLTSCDCPLKVELNCGADGKTYANNCLRECDSVAIQHEGPCETGNCPCSSRFYEPNCGADKLTYANHCLRQCAEVDLFHEGPCTDEECGCPLTLNINCGMDGKTYPNSCLRECRGVGLKGPGSCDRYDACFCPKINEPNCGADGKTYVNHCFRECHDVELKHEGRCTEEDCLCSPIFELNCGEDGTTYANHCMRECQGVSLGSLGPCPFSEQKPSLPNITTTTTTTVATTTTSVATTTTTVAATATPVATMTTAITTATLATTAAPTNSTISSSSNTNDPSSTPDAAPAGATNSFSHKQTRCDMCPPTVLLNCGDNGTTYENHCQRECQGVRLLHEGPCELQDKRRYRGISKIPEPGFPGVIGAPMRTIRRMDY
ncbi:Kazal-type serine protease inhibitor domain-containing protein [Toxoplasma gondii RUB]|uniref:Kazal-type serine protease inhibitor domain-containing protein n=1 Tax=Toxoplasma gondii RUB TaxID=935652 RepID=A0A086LQC3_TOXGO|nr:Kazal-type serine protease inhibitor domain-containing protein [Toxoplasma gondii RUB]